MSPVVINHKTTKFESNSQRSILLSYGNAWLLSIAKLQNLKAIHNIAGVRLRVAIVVINHKTTKFESNSQRSILLSYGNAWLLSIAKLQNLKAIHNATIDVADAYKVVINHKTTKFESNSQLSLSLLDASFSCYQSQTTKFESNSQRQFHCFLV